MLTIHITYKNDFIDIIIDIIIFTSYKQGMER